MGHRPPQQGRNGFPADAGDGSDEFSRLSLILEGERNHPLSKLLTFFVTFITASAPVELIAPIPCQQARRDRLPLNRPQLSTNRAANRRPPFGLLLGLGRRPPMLEMKRPQLGQAHRRLRAGRATAMQPASGLASNSRTLAGLATPGCGPASYTWPIGSKLPMPGGLSECHPHFLHLHCQRRFKGQGPRTLFFIDIVLAPIARAVSTRSNLPDHRRKARRSPTALGACSLDLGLYLVRASVDPSPRERFPNTPSTQRGLL